MTTYKELKEKAEDLMRQAEAARKTEIGAAIAEIKAKMVAYGITLDDLGGKAKAARGRKPKGGKVAAKAAKPAKPAKAKPVKARKPVAIKYRNAATNETWTGRGKPPTWLKAQEAAGRKREEFLVGH
jgi:DNA-binding protein H-NS